MLSVIGKIRNKEGLSNIKNKYSKSEDLRTINLYLLTFFSSILNIRISMQ